MANGQSEQPMTFEQIEEHVKDLDLEQFNRPQAAGAAGAQEDLASKMQQVCKIFKAIKPILKAVLSFPLIPSVIKTPLQTFVNVMSSICP
jgi:hypothetical protein